jgi:hypothetical protein
VETKASVIQVIGAEPLGQNNMADAASCKAAGVYCVSCRYFGFMLQLQCSP